jgi:DNA-binding transcriptional LysR family regulator
MIEPFTLRVFRAVAEMLNYRRSADELHLTQPSVIALIRSVQESLGYLGV